MIHELSNMDYREPERKGRRCDCRAIQSGLQIAVAVGILTAVLGCSQPFQPDAEEAPTPQENGERDGTSGESIDDVLGIPPAPAGSGYSGERFSVRTYDGGVDQAIADALPAREVRRIEMHRETYTIYEVRDGVRADDVAGALDGLRGMAAEPTVEFTTFGSADVDAPAFHNGMQYAPQLTNSDEAWDTATGDGVIVAILDTGIQGEHIDLGEDALVPGYDFVEDEPISPGDNADPGPTGHGSHVAGIVGARADNAFGMAGIAWEAQLMDVRVLGTLGGGNSADIAAGIVHAADEGADIINLSLGGPASDQAMRAAVQYALAEGVVVVAAMGNDGFAFKNYPAYYPGVIAVGSTDAADELSIFSTRGSHVSVVAPGSNIYSMVNAGNTAYEMFNGTSMAAPVAAAASALLLEAESGLTPAEVQRILEVTATDIGLDEREMGHGRIDVGAAVATADNPPGGFGYLEVSVKDANDTPVAGVEVLLLDDTGEKVLRSTRTSDGAQELDKGTAYFGSLPAGGYTVTVQFDSGSGPESATKSANVTDSETETVLLAADSIAPVSHTIETFPISDNPIHQNLLYSDPDDGPIPNWFAFTVPAQ